MDHKNTAIEFVLKSRSTMYRCSCHVGDRKYHMESSFQNSNSQELEIKLNFYHTQEIWNWIQYQDSTLLGPITSQMYEHEASPILVGKSWSRQDLRGAVGKSIGNYPSAADKLTDLAWEGLREILEADDSQPSYGVLRLSSCTYAKHHHVHGFENISGRRGMVPAAESSFHLLEKCEVGRGSRADEGNCCSICLDNFAGKALLRMPCSHVFHGDCIKKWLRRSHYCPLCRYQMPTK